MPFPHSRNFYRWNPKALIEAAKAQAPTAFKSDRALEADRKAKEAAEKQKAKQKK
jgi:hypothetical protein